MGVGVLRDDNRREGAFAFAELDLEGGNDLSRQLVLNRENVGELAIESLGPDVAAIAASISWPVTRTRLPALRTLPSRT